MFFYHLSGKPAVGIPKLAGDLYDQGKQAMRRTAKEVFMSTTVSSWGLKLSAELICQETEP
jgi:hypothetical protein